MRTFDFKTSAFPTQEVNVPLLDASAGTGRRGGQIHALPASVQIRVRTLERPQPHHGAQMFHH